MSNDVDTVNDSIRPDANKTPPHTNVRGVRYLMPVAYPIFASIALPLSTGLLVPFGALLQMPYLILFVFLIALAIGNFALSFQTCGKKADTLYFVRTMLIVRFGMIPFILWFALQILALVNSAKWGDLKLFGSCFICWIVISLFFLLPGAFYGIRVIRLLLREKKISRDAAIFHVVAQFIPLLGFLDIAFLSAVTMKKVRITSLVLMMIIVALLCLILYLILVNRFAINFARAWQDIDLFVRHRYPIPALFY